jgi:exopolysaccharide biosynthesis protein
MKDGQVVAPVSRTPANRSVMAFRADGRIFLLNSTPATLEQLVQIMTENLGVYHAINLDGGGSAGLYFHGRYLIEPRRLIPNALVFHKL